MSIKSKMSPKARRAFVEEYALSLVSMELADALAASGKTQRELANELGLTEARISQILNNKGNVTVKTLAIVADALGFDLNVGFVRQERPRAAYVVESVDAHPRGTAGWDLASGSYRAAPTHAHDLSVASQPAAISEGVLSAAAA